ncbi:MAG: RNA polymerase sigma factor [Acidobacteriota bacterium]
MLRFFEILILLAAPARAAGAAAERPSEPNGSVLESWMLRYQEGDAEAFEQLFDALAQPLRRYLLHLTLRTDLADDLLQETFLQLHRSRRTYVAPRPVKPWAYGIARNVFLMNRRSRRRRDRVESPQDDAILELAAPVTEADVSDKDLLRRSIARLPDDRREILLLHHVLGHSFKDIAGILGIRVGAAKVRAHRAMKSLRVLMGAADA